MEKFTSTRDALQKQVTKVCAFLDGELLKDDLGPSDWDGIMARLKTLNKFYEKLNKANLSVETYLKPDERESEFERIFECETQVERINITVNRRLQERDLSADKPVVKSTAQGPAEVAKPPTNSSSTLRHSFYKLPALEITPFSGGFKEWDAFWNLFSHAVDTQDHFPPAIKLQYLILLLRGPPLEMVQDLEFYDENYSIAIEQLKARYGRIEDLRHQHLEELLHLEPIPELDDLKAIWSLQNKAFVHILTLKRLKVGVEIFFDRILKLFPMELVLPFLRKEQKDRAVTDLLDFIREDLNLRERWEYFQNFRQDPTVESTEAPQSGSSESGCLFCGGTQHSGRICMAKISLQEKRDILIAQRRCAKCMKKGHGASECRFSFKGCGRCNYSRDHFVSLCPTHPYANYNSEANSAANLSD